MENRIRTPLIVVSILALFGTAVSVLRDGSTGPAGLVPSPSAISAGSSTSLQITLNQSSDTDTVIDMSSSSTYFSVPSTVTIPAGDTVGYATGVSSDSEPSEAPTITASANGLEAQCQVSVAAVG